MSGSISRVLVFALGAMLSMLPEQICCASSKEDSSSQDRVTSQALFEKGRALFIDGRFSEACPVLAESHRLAPGVGVLLHLGACFERLGKLASAWAAFQEAADRAQAEGDAERESLARSRAAKLRQKLSHLTVRLHQVGSIEPIIERSQPSGLQVLRDGHPLSIAALGVEEPVDSGRHVIVVEGPSVRNVSREVTLSDGQHVEVDIEIVPLSTPRTTPPRPTPSGSTSSPMVRERRESSLWPSVAWASFGLGAASIVTGTVAGIVAFTKMHDARAVCQGHPQNQCPDEAIRLQNQAKMPANIATGGVAIGVGCIAFAGAYWLLTPSGHTMVTGRIGPGNSLIAIQTRW